MSEFEIIWTDEKDKFLKENYHRMSYAKMGEAIGIPFRFRNRVIRRCEFLGIRRSRGNEFNHDIFESWNSKSAYLLGYIATDGSISVDSIHCDLNIRAGDLDKEHLIYLNNLFESKKEVSYNKSLNSWYIALSSKKTCRDLMDLGIVPNKSYVGYFIQVPDKWFRQFLIGMLDGDGSIFLDRRRKTYHLTWRLSQSKNCERFMRYLKGKIKELFGKEPSWIVREDGLITLQFTCKTAYEFLKWLYENCEYKMERKYKCFEIKHNQLINNLNN